MNSQISVIIPAFNAERYLAAAIASVLAQTLPPAEIIVVDDGSTDDTAAVARRWPVRYQHKTHGGVATARNLGVELARGEWLAFLDADDLWLPDKLAGQMARFASEPDLDLLFGQVEQFHSPDVPQHAAFLPDGNRFLDGYVAGTLLLRRDTFLRLGFFATTWEVGDFYEWYARAQDAGLKIAVLPQVVLRRRLHDDNLGLRRQDAARRDYVRVMKTILERRRARA
jgi:glycosyltransferase involved in cell wall biosynthesis